MSERIYVDGDDNASIRFQGGGYSMPVTLANGVATPVVTDAIMAALVDPFPYDETIPVYAATADATMGTNTLVLVEAPRRMTALTVGHIDLYVATSSGNLDVGVYSFDGTTWTLLTSSGSTAAGDATSRQTVTLLDEATRQPGERWFYGFAGDNGTLTIRRTPTNVAAVTSTDQSAVIKTSSFPLATNAASFTTAAVTGALILPWLRAKA